MSTVDLSDMELTAASAPTAPTPLIEDIVTDPPGGWGRQSLLIRQIRRDGGTQARVGLDEATVQEYAELMREHRWDFASIHRPIVLFDGTSFWLADGFHRIEAAQRAGLSDYLVEVLRGTQRDAIFRACGANSQHGKRRTRADVQRAIELLLEDAEWRQWSNVKIAAQVGCSDKTVAEVRRHMEASSEIPRMETRTVERNGTTYQMTPAAPKPAPARPPAPAGWTWRENGSLRHIMGGTIIAPKATDAETIAAAEAYNARLAPAPAPIETDDHATMEEIRTLAGALGLELVWEDDAVLLYWPGENLDDIEPMSYERAIDWLLHDAARLRPVREVIAEYTAAAEPDTVPAPASYNAAGYDAIEKADQQRIMTAQNAIERGDYAGARALLGQVQVTTYARDKVLATLEAAEARTAATIDVTAQARAFLADQRERLTRMNHYSMISLPTFTQALDHLAAVLSQLEETAVS